jgi:predicted metal-dependent peptidase
MEAIKLTKEDIIKLGIKRVFPDLSSDILTNIKINLDEIKEEDQAEAYINKENIVTINRKFAINRLQKTFNSVSDSLENSYLLYLYTHETFHFILKHFSRFERILKNNKSLIESISQKLPNFNIFEYLNIEADIELNYIIFNELQFIFEPVFKGQKNEKDNILNHLRNGYCAEPNVHNEIIGSFYNFCKNNQILKKELDYTKYFTNTHYFEENILKLLNFFNDLELIQNGGGNGNNQNDSGEGNGGGNGDCDNCQNPNNGKSNNKKNGNNSKDFSHGKKFQRKIEKSDLNSENEKKEGQKDGQNGKEQSSQKTSQAKEGSFSKNKLQSDIASKEAGANSLNSILEKIELQEVKKLNIKNLLKNLKTTLKSGHEYESFAIPKASALSRKEISPKVFLEEEKDGKIVIVVDTSGSVFSPDIFGRFVKVFEQIIEFTSKENIKVFVIFIDTKIQETIEIKEKESIRKSLEKFVKNIKGGGGTELNPAIAHILKDKKMKNAKMIFTITDGYLSSSLMRTKIKNIVLLPENEYSTNYLNGAPWYLF